MKISKLLPILLAFSFNNLAHSNETIAEKDLALIFPIDEQNLIKANETIQGETIFPRQWYDEINRSFAHTAIGGALISENYFSDWVLVSARIDPCSTFMESVSADNDDYCWPELRLVWQPVLYDFVFSGQRFQHYADDRAFHTLYDVQASHFLSADLAFEANELMKRAKQGSLSQTELNRFTELRNEVSKGYMERLLNLRSANISSSEYQQIGDRPEAINGDQIFFGKVRSFLSKFANPKNLKVLTAFSLPEGRQPALIDEWVFVAFSGSNGQIQPAKTSIKSHITGEEIINLGFSQKASTRRDDTRLYEDGVIDAVRDSVILFTTDFNRLGSTIANRKQRLVPNTSCASCHKLNTERFNFHNLSYLQDRPFMTISNRVVKDVEFDLAWIEEHLSGDSGSGNGGGNSGGDNGGSPNVDPVIISSTQEMAIPDNNPNGISTTLNASGLNHSSVSIEVNIEHSYIGDLVVDIETPTGEVFTLHNKSGGSQNDVQISKQLTTASTGFNGTWTLKVSDHANQDVGKLLNWKLIFNP